MKQELIPLDNPLRWKNALDNVPHAFGHSWESCYAMHLTTGYPTYLYLLTAGDVKVVCPIAEREYNGLKDILTPYGFSGFVGNKDFPNFQTFWNRFMQELGYVSGYIGLNPLFENSSYLNKNKVYSYNTLFILDLRLTLPKLFQNLSTNRKRQLKSFENFKVNFTIDKALLIPFFQENYYNFFSDRNAAQVYYFSKETISYLLNLKNVLIVGVYLNNKIEAVSVFAHTPDVAEYLFNISVPEGQHHTVALLWYGIIHLKSLGIPYLNLGGGVVADDSIADFKKRFGADEYELKCIKQVYNTLHYEMLCNEINWNPENREGYFPAYRKP